MKRISALLTAAVMLLSWAPTAEISTLPEPNRAEIVLNRGSEGLTHEGTIAKIELEGEKEASPAVVENAGRKLLSMNGVGSIPSDYSSVTQGYITPVRNQVLDGTCWLFAGMATAEASYAKNTGIKTHFSVLQMGNLVNGRVYDVLGNSTGDYNDYNITALHGGNSYYTMLAAASWSGLEPESVLPFNDEMCRQLEKGTTDKTLLYGNDIAHLEQAHYLSYSTDSRYMNIYKSLIMQYGALVTAYFHDDNAYNAKTGAHYTDRKEDQTNHEVAVVGWNDNYPASNFAPYRPEGNGAWLIKNSWGPGWGTDGDSKPSDSGAEGYFWLSYYDVNIDKMQAMNFEPADDYKYNYHFDGGIGTGSIMVEAGNSVATKYTVRGLTSDKEAVKAVGFFVESYNATGTVSVYADTTNRNPMRGEKLAEKSFSFALPGYYTVKLDEPVVLSAGENFSAAVTFNTETQFSVDMNTEESFGKVFPDYTDEHSFYIAPNGGMYKFSEASEPITPRIKVLTDDAGEKATENHTVTFDAGDKASCLPVTQIKAKGQDLRLQFTVPVRSDCEFLGWTTQYRGESVEYLPGDYYREDKDTVMYAVWDYRTPEDAVIIPKTLNLPVGANITVRASYFPGKFALNAVPVSAEKRTENGKTVYYSDGLRIEPLSGNEYFVSAVPGSEGKTVTVELRDEKYPQIPIRFSVNIVSGRKGDINRDGKVNALDSLLQRRIILGRLVGSEYSYLADINGDGKVSIIDSYLIKKIILGVYTPN